MTEVISDQYCQIEAKSPVHFADAAIDFVGGVAGMFALFNCYTAKNKFNFEISKH